MVCKINDLLKRSIAICLFLERFWIDMDKNKTSMRLHIYIGLCFFFFGLSGLYAQNDLKDAQRTRDSSTVFYYIIEGDTIARDMIDLDEVILMEKLHFKSETERRRYLILRRKTLKVYPYAKLAAERLVTMKERLGTLKSNREKRIYTRRVQKYVEEEFSDELKKFTRSEGQILVKLIYRQTGITAFDMVKELRTGWKAFWYNVTANVFEISLKEEFRPFEVEEDYLIEDILERSFQDYILERQAPATEVDFLDLKAHWNKKNLEKSKIE